MNKPIVVNARFLTQPITGTQRFAIDLCRFLRVYHSNIVFWCPDNIIHKDIADELNVQVVGKIKKGILWEQLELPLLLRRHGNPILLNLCNLAPLLYHKNIVSVLDLSFKLHPEWFSKRFSILYNFFVPRVATNALRVLTISENSKEDIEKYFRIPASRINVIYPSVSEIFLHTPPVTENVVNKYSNYILAVSSIDPRKNFAGLIKAFKLGPFRQTKLVIVGSEHKVFANNDLKELVAGDPNIIFTGYITDKELVQLYQNALLFAYPSYFEGFGIPPLEAMACGCPTLVSNTTSLPEVCGDASVYVDPYDVDSIHNGLSMILNDEQLRKELVEKGYKQILKFNWDQSAQQLTNIISQLEAVDQTKT